MAKRAHILFEPIGPCAGYFTLEFTSWRMFHATCCRLTDSEAWIRKQAVNPTGNPEAGGLPLAYLHYLSVVFPRWQPSGGIVWTTHYQKLWEKGRGGGSLWPNQEVRLVAQYEQNYSEARILLNCLSNHPRGAHSQGSNVRKHERNKTW